MKNNILSTFYFILILFFVTLFIQSSTADDELIIVPYATFESPSLEPVRNSWTALIRRIRGSIDNLTQRIRSEINNNKSISETREVRTFYIEKNSTGNAKNNRMIEIVSLPGDSTELISCRIYGNPSTINDRIKSYSSNSIKYVKNSEMQNVLSKCQDFFKQQMAKFNSNTRIDSNNNTESNSTNENEESGLFDGIAIYPGTKWCGAGDIADNYDDLGTEAEADACCREHDHCDDNIKAGNSKYGLSNNDSYTKSSCECDEKFHQCLREAKSFIGDQIGRTYFNVLQTECFKEDHPIIECEDEKGFVFNTVRKACQSYKLDKQKPKVYQFFDAKFYDGQAGPLFNIPGISKYIDPTVKAVKNHTINGGIVGNLLG